MEITAPSRTTAHRLDGTETGSATMRKIRSRTSLLKRFLPAARRVRDSQDQYNRNPMRCQRTTVSGVTSRSRFFHLDHSFRRATQNTLSTESSRRRRSFGMESQQLLTQCQILQHQVLAGSKCADKPADEVACATSSRARPLASSPSLPWQSVVRVASPSGYSGVASRGCAVPQPALPPPAGNAAESCLAW